MASRGFTTGMSFALLSQKMATISKIKEESRMNTELIDKRKQEELDLNRWRIKERSEISSALRETNRLSMEMK